MIEITCCSMYLVKYTSLFSAKPLSRDNLFRVQGLYLDISYKKYTFKLWIFHYFLFRLQNQIWNFHVFGDIRNCVFCIVFPNRNFTF